MLRYLVACLAFTVGGVWLAAGGKTLGWAVAGLFGLGAVVFAVQLLPASAYLRLDERGFTMRVFFRDQSLRWSDVRDFRPGWIGVNRYVLFDFTDSYARAPALRKINSSLVAAESALPDTYGLSPERLAVVMNEARASALRGSSR